MLSVVTSGRYMYWRLTATTYWEHPLDAAWGLLLVSAEVYSTIVLLLGYFQTAWPLKRTPMPLPASRDQWPTVDVFIPTYNEPLSVVKPTIYAALALDYPADKIVDPRARRRPPPGVQGVLRGSRRQLDDPHAQPPREGRQHQRSAEDHPGRVPRDLRLRSHSDPLVPADRPRLVPARQAAVDAADAAPLLLRRSVRAQSRHLPQGAERRRTVLRPRAGRQRPVERDLLLRLVRAAAPDHGRRDRRHRGRNRHRRRAHRAEAAPPRLHHRVSRDSAGGRVSPPKACPATSASGFAGRAA